MSKQFDLDHKLKTIVICRSDPRHLFFANKMDEISNVKALIVQRSPALKEKLLFPTFTRKINELYKYIRLLILNKKNNEASYFFSNVIPEFNNSNYIEVTDINSETVIGLVRRVHPDIILTFGCGILKHDEWFDSSKYGIINLHSGIVPSYRGVDNVFWCLFNHDPNMIGATIHYIDRKIDTGNVLAQVFTPIDKDDNEYTLFNKTIMHGINAFEIVINKISLLKNIPIGKSQTKNGHLYQEKDRNMYCDIRVKYYLLRNGLKDYVREGKYEYYL